MPNESTPDKEYAPHNIAFGRVVRRYRAAGKITQEQLAWSLGMRSRSYVKKLETGESGPGWGIILRVAEGLNISVVELVTAAVEELKKEERRRARAQTKENTRTPLPRKRG